MLRKRSILRRACSRIDSCCAFFKGPCRRSTHIWFVYPPLPPFGRKDWREGAKTACRCCDSAESPRRGAETAWGTKTALGHTRWCGGIFQCTKGSYPSMHKWFVPLNAHMVRIPQRTYGSYSSMHIWFVFLDVQMVRIPSTPSPP